ncbi:MULTISPECIES: CheR family methyltransferase [unclassified Mesorhizobium]|uniref:CheR family methyltransferase n=1 Tax=unclassified Mesorhizobium TaxID=325217 RepID=UPI000F75EFF9|nr:MULTISPECIES: CheR family methyltransferase [unclassified Mesorhizobium]AZO53749.1 PAS domain S-box protein [Mesorhizobium sp. M8A.F.Ca.ET.057.01.1.1]RWE46044.1 MAG: PAS domain S-box protein [Mesorhizobium sp.]
MAQSPKKVTARKPQTNPGDRTVAPANGSFPIVGIGASAGGIGALQKFFPEVPADSGFAYVVIQHLDAEHESVLASIIQRCTSIETQPAAEGIEIERNKIYVIPPGVSVTVGKHRFHVAKMAPTRARRTPIDDFFTSLALEQGEHAAGVILSGTGSDGTIGLRAIKERGGLTLAQESAEYDGMMRSAVQSGLVDMVLPAEEMADKLVSYFRHSSRTEGERDRHKRDVGEQLSRIAALLRMRTGHDFSGYKDNTILRRIQRRMQVLQIDDPTAFYERLREEPQQVDLLFQDLLIGVTSFFRDPQAFDALERLVIPKLFEGRKPDETIRVWVPGCATGEEAYSIAMLLKENAPRGAASPNLQIFATDIDERALEVARAGRYPATIATDITPKRLKEFFSREDGTYRVASDLREACLFSSHNLLRDPPFSKLDLLACRNLLIYMGPELQEKIVPIFHYALRNNGYLFLGSSENVTRHARLFATIDKPSRLFQKRGGVLAQRLPEFPLAAAARQAAPHTRLRAPTSSLQEMAERLLLDRYAPAYVVINAAGELMHSSGGTGKYLELAAGAPDNNVFALARRGMRMDLRAALHKAVSTGQAAVQNKISIGTNGGRQTISLVVQPLPAESGADPLYMLVFRDVGSIKPESESEPIHTTDDVESANVSQLEKELRETKERLQITTEELESSNEELKSSNEELSSINEELQSSNEELETSKEELQSINEELQTVNAELNIRVDELSRANNDMANLLESTQIATVFLDRDLCIKSFTPTARDLFRLVESDVGRPLAHVRPRFPADGLQADMEQVLHRLGTIERQVEGAESGRRYIMRVLPYRTVDNVIAGVVVTFVDVTQIAKAEERIGALSHDLRNRVESLETLLDLVPVGIFIAEDGNGEEIRGNRHAVELAGGHATADKLIPMPAALPLVLNGATVDANDQPLLMAMRTGKAIPGYEARIARADGGSIDVTMSANPLFDETGKVRGAIAALIDISNHKKAERSQERLLHELQHRVKNILATITALTSRMIRSSSSMSDFSTSFQERLQAMARTHEFLSSHNWEGADLEELIRATLSPYSGAERRHVLIHGRRIRLNASAAATLGLVFFELASNAAKYGAFSVESGRIEVSWPEQKHDRVTILWEETGGPSLSQPAKKNFGTTFIQQSLQYELGGTVDLQFKPSGLVCVLDLPLPQLEVRPPLQAMHE